MNLEDFRKRVQKCKVCKGTGWVLKSGKVTECECSKDAAYEVRLSNATIPERFRNLEFKDYIYKNSITFQNAQKYLDKHNEAVSKGVGLFLSGPPKAGQTPLAISITKELMKLGYSSSFVTYAGMLSKVSDNNLDADKYGRAYTFLCIDNITDVLDNLVNFKSSFITGGSVNFAVTYLESILSLRLSMKLPTIITSRASIDAINMKFPSLGLTLLGSFLSIDCVADDFRGQKLKDKLVKDFSFDEL